MPAKRPILVVDDEPEILHSLRGLLRRDFDVHTAPSGAEAIAILEEHDIHVVMTDQRMPQMTGVEFLKRVKAAHPEAIRLIFTGYADIQAIIDAVNQGNIYRYVCKPWDPEELIRALHDAGELYDRLGERERLLADLREHEQACVAFDDELRAGQTGSMEPMTAARLTGLFGKGRALLARLGSVLRGPRPLA
jgi:DNA-binding NtrC family response regulator